MLAKLHPVSLLLSPSEMCDFRMWGHNQRARQKVLFLIFPAVQTNYLPAAASTAGRGIH